MRLVNFLDRRLVPLCVTGLVGAFACWLLALAVVLAGCGADPDLYDQSPATTGNRCGELSDDVTCEGE